MIPKVNTTKYFLKYFSIIFLIILLISFFILVFIEKKIAKMQSTEIKYEEYLLLLMENKIINQELEFIINDIDYLSKTYNEKNPYIKDNWRLFSSTKKCYSKIRFIDIDGNEKIVVDYQKDNPLIIEDARLKNVKEENYFKKSLNIQKGKIFISKLNVLEGKPLIYFSVPVYDEGFNGIIVLEYNLQHLLIKIKDISINSNGVIYLINEEGECLFNSVTYDNNSYEKANYIKVKENHRNK
jgi:hypothetical protein